MKESTKHALILYGGIVFAIGIHLVPILLIWLFTGELPPLLQPKGE